jgi:heme oxygenase (biliverdin-IX-beta and delta-forming)
LPPAGICKAMNEQGFSAAAAARRVLRQAASGSLATLCAGGGPFASLVSVATTPAGEPILLLSRLAQHTANLAGDRRASLLLVAPGGEGGDPLAGARLTLTGSVAGPEGDPALARRFLARHEEAAGYAGFADFGFYRLVPDSGHLVAGFGRIVALAPTDFLTDVAGAEALAAAEESAIAHMNGGHAEALSLFATRLLAMPAGEWRMTGVDPDGVDLRAGPLRARLDFPEPVTSPAGLRSMLARLAESARATRRSP